MKYQAAMKLMNTSVDDAKVDIQKITDLDVLGILKAKCIHYGHKTRLKIVESRIKQLLKEAA